MGAPAGCSDEEAGDGRGDAALAARCADAVVGVGDASCAGTGTANTGGGAIAAVAVATVAGVAGTRSGRATRIGLVRRRGVRGVAVGEEAAGGTASVGAATVREMALAAGAGCAVGTGAAGTKAAAVWGELVDDEA